MQQKLGVNQVVADELTLVVAAETQGKLVGIVVAPVICKVAVVVRPENGDIRRTMGARWRGSRLVNCWTLNPEFAQEVVVVAIGALNCVGGGQPRPATPARLFAIAAEVFLPAP